jgi:hypothetical protein
MGEGRDINSTPLKSLLCKALSSIAIKAYGKDATKTQDGELAFCTTHDTHAASPATTGNQIRLIPVYCILHHIPTYKVF